MGRDVERGVLVVSWDLEGRGGVLWIWYFLNSCCSL